MATPVIMPRQGQSVESCIITKWFKQTGDKVNVGDLLFNYETDKAAFDEESKVSGTLLAVFFQEGDDVPCLTNVCVIGEKGEDFEAFNPNSSAPEATKEVKAEVSKTDADAQTAKNADREVTNSPIQISDSKGTKISPRAKKLAEKQGVDTRKAVSTGPHGRIIEQDIQNLIDKGELVTGAASEEYLASGNVAQGSGIGGRVSLADLSNMTEAAGTAAVAGDITEVKLSNIRKVIAKAMHNSLATMAQLTLNSSFDATDILSYRNKIKVGMEKTGIGNITINDMILFAVSKTLLSHADLNAHYFDDKMLLFKNVNLGIAVDTPRGLMVPTLFGANLKSLNQLSSDAKTLIESCQKGTISPDGLKGGTFTVTNLGALGIESFTPVINPPQTGILGVNTIEVKVKEVNGKFEYYKSIGLSLTFDHRALDGAPAAKFLKDLTINLENFSTILAK